MFRSFRCAPLMRTLSTALALLACVGYSRSANAQAMMAGPPPPAPVQTQWDSGVVNYQPQPQFQPQPPQPLQGWAVPSYDSNPYGPPVTTYNDQNWGGPAVVMNNLPGEWYPQVLPDGLMYRSYWAGVHEPRLGAVFEHISGDHSFIDATGGGRAALWRYGTSRSAHAARL